MMNIPDFDQFVHGELLVPTVLVLATETAQESILKTTGGMLSVAQLLSPFGGSYTPMSVQYRVLDTPVRTNGFKVRFLDPAACQYNNNGEEEGLKMFSSCSFKRNFFEKYFSAFCNGLKFSPFDCLSQPIATVLVVSSSEPNAIDAFEQLSHVANQPEACRSGLLDPTSARVKLLIHDRAGGVEDSQADQIIAQLMQIYTGNSVAFFPFNSNSDAAPDISAIFNITSPVPFTFQDVESLGKICEQIVKENALPWMERKLQLLDANITAKRKGLRNQLRNFLRNEPQNIASGGQLSLQQVEWQCRLAGDIAFHMRAHEIAFGFYRNVASDFKQDRSLVLAGAGCYEMSALCALLSSGESASSAETARFAETAVELYKEGKSGHVIRAAIFQAFVLRGRTEAADKLIRINGELSADKSHGLLRSAVILDLAASLHGACKMRRKEAFTRVLAGHMFNKVEGGKELALEAYSAVLPIYGPNWGYIRDHLLFTMAKLEFGLGHGKAALKLMKDLLCVSPQSVPRGTVEKHVNYLKLLSYISKSVSAVEDFPIPQIVDVKLEDSSLMVSVSNPLLVPLEFGGLHVEFVQKESAESETCGLIRLEAGETKNISLMVLVSGQEIRLKAVRWTLFDALHCLCDI